MTFQFTLTFESLLASMPGKVTGDGSDDIGGDKRV